METVDEEFLDSALDFIERQHKVGEPFFCWWNSTRMHIWTHLEEGSQGVTGRGVHPDGMVEHDGHVGRLLDKLDELGIADNTIVMCSTDNGAEVMTWPDGGTTPFRGEKDTNWEGDMLPTLLAVAGDPDIVETAKRGVEVGGKTFKVHLDGYNLLPLVRGKVDESPRPGFIYWSDDGDLLALRYGNWKFHFAEQSAHGLGVWEEPFVHVRAPSFFNLRSSPFEIDAEEATFFFNKEKADRTFSLLPAVALVSQYLQTFEEFPPRQRPASFSIDQALEKARERQAEMEAVSGGR